MKVLQVHNFYQNPGGEDQACAAEYELLTSRGHNVSQYLVHNDAINHMSGISAGLRTIWNPDTYSRIQELIRRDKPQVVHAHNTFPLVSPSLYYAASSERIPVVQTLHNYRLLCPAATLYRDGGVCEECLGAKVPYSSVLHSCYRNSRSASAVTASLLFTHQVAQTWRTKVDSYVALSHFSKAKFIQGGLPAPKIVVKPNCLAKDPGIGEGRGGYALFAGRLTEGKGLRCLLVAWEQLSLALRLKIAGDGPLAGWLRERLPTLSNVEWLGHCERPLMTELLQNAALLVFPSEFYENLPMTIIEAFACGTPVMASRSGAMKEIVEDGVNGAHFEPGNADDLGCRLKAILSDASQLQTMRKGARRSYEENYTAERNYILLMDVYHSAILKYKKN